MITDGWRRLAACLAVIAAARGATVTLAQRPDEPIHRRLAETFKRDYLSLGVLLQTVADWQDDRTAGSNGFSIPNFRLLLSGELDDGFGYAFQANMARAPAILDARMYAKLSSRVALDVGQFKAPFSKEFLTYAGSIDFVNRSQVVTALAPGRQLGAQLRVTNAARTFEWSAGAFNGNGIAPGGNDNDDFLVATRVALLPAANARNQLEVALNAARSTDRLASFGGGFVTGFTGTRTLFGADARWIRGPWLAAGEVIYGELEPAVGFERTPWGFHLTGGYLVGRYTQLLVRWDGFEPDDGGARRDLVILGLNWWPTSATEFQLNWGVNTRDADPGRHQWLLNVQFGF